MDRPVPQRSCAPLRYLLGSDSRWHDDRCGHLPSAGLYDTEGVDDGSVPTISTFLGIGHPLCEWITTPPGTAEAAQLAQGYLQLKALHLPPQDRIRPDDAPAWARALMRQRRALNELSTALRRWTEDFVRTTTGLHDDLESWNEGAAAPDPVVDRSSTSFCCEGCVEFVELISVMLLALHTEHSGRWLDVVRSDASRALLISVTADLRPVTMALDNYLPQEGTTLDHDMSDAIVAAFTDARAQNRLAGRLPLGLAGYVSINRRPGGMTESVRGQSAPDDVLETALILWEPEGVGPYRRWSAALQAARLLR